MNLIAQVRNTTAQSMQASLPKQTSLSVASSIQSSLGMAGTAPEHVAEVLNTKKTVDLLTDTLIEGSLEEKLIPKRAKSRRSSIPDIVGGIKEVCTCWNNKRTFRKLRSWFGVGSINLNNYRIDPILRL